MGERGVTHTRHNHFARRVNFAKRQKYITKRVLCATTLHAGVNLANRNSCEGPASLN